MPTIADLKPDPKTSRWRNRIVRYADVPPDQLLANPKNWRIHPRHQQDALAGTINEVGYVDPVTVQDGTDVVIDGHLRVTLAIRDGVPAIPVAYTDLSDAEADVILATHDPIAALAGRDDEQLNALLASIQTENEDLDRFLSALNTDVPTVAPPDDFGSYGEDIATEHRCPACGYEWSGKSS